MADSTKSARGGKKASKTANSTKAAKFTCPAPPAGSTPKEFEKPREDFPLFPHRNGRWAKKVRGKFEYFGKCADDPKGEAALTEWLEQKDNLLAGRGRRKANGGIVVKDLCNRFLTSKKHLLDTGEITPRSFRDYYVTCEKLIEVFGGGRLVEDLGPDDFEKLRAKLATTRGPVALGNEIARCRMPFKYAFDNGLIEKPIRWGQSFAKPSRKTLRKARAAGGVRMFEADELRRIIAAAGVPLKSMILLAINAGLGQSDCANLPAAAIHPKTGWLDYPRPKTGIDRRVPLWPETITALKEAIDARPAPKSADDEGLAFITKYGLRWVRTVTSEDKKKDGTAIDAISQEFRKVLKSLGINGKRGFYAIRHTFATIGGASRDQVAVNAIMGHVDNSMAAAYRERIDDERLQAVTDHVRAWLWPAGWEEADKAADEKRTKAKKASGKKGGVK
jgi:integrase